MRTPHETGVCPYRIVACPLHCGVPLRADKVEVRQLVIRVHLTHSAQVHVQTECIRRQVPCKFADLGCTVIGPQSDIDAHARDGCKYRSIACPLQCGAKIAAKDLAVHSSHACPLQVIHCPYGCDAHMQRRNVSKHRAKYCTTRTVWCEGSVLYRRLQKQLESGEAVDLVHPSPIPAPWNPAKFGLTVPITFEIPQLSSGDFLGCESALQWGDLHRHLQHGCKNRPFPCEYVALGVELQFLVSSDDFQVLW